MAALTARISRSLKYRVKQVLNPILERGDARWCPVCGKSARRFLPSGNPPRLDAKCAFCSSLERHRFIWWYLQAQTDLMNGAPKRMLHFAPEHCFGNRFQELVGEGYLSADLMSPRAMVKVDIMDIQFDDESFDVIYCSHVLEHVPDDRKAIRELYRVLKPDGWALIAVPIIAEQSFEDPTIVTPEARQRAYGQWDHLRRYGPDFLDRLTDAGFQVRVAYVNDFFDAAEIERIGLGSATGEIFYCTK